MDAINAAIVVELNRLYPEFVKSVRDVEMYDFKVHDAITKKYGIKSFERIQKINEYNSEFENIVSKKAAYSDMRKYAEKRHSLFNVYSLESYKLAKEIGMQKTLQYLDILQNHFKQITHISQ